MAPPEEPNAIVRTQLHEALTALYRAGDALASLDEYLEVAEAALKYAWLEYIGEPWMAPLDDEEEEDDEPDDEGSDGEDEDFTLCHVCRGTGSFDRDSKCTTCYGTGTIKRD